MRGFRTLRCPLRHHGVDRDKFISYYPSSPRRICEDNIKMDLQEDGGGRGDWMELAQDRDG